MKNAQGVIFGIIILMVAIWRPCTGFATLPHVWTGNPTNPYGLTDLDNFSDGYNYCKWGNLLSNDSSPVFGISMHSFNYLTQAPYSYKNTDLFLTKSLSSLQLIALPDVAPATTNAHWTPPSMSEAGSVVWIPGIGDGNSILFRKLHFKSDLTDEITNTTLGSDSSKIIVVIHGWNRTSDSNPFLGEFESLKTSLTSVITNKGWKLVFYDWHEDADTGGVQIDLSLGPDPVNPTRAAEIANLHGQHLGELLASKPNLQKVHFIAHSAGAWAARAAAKYLLQNTGAKVQITFLDPFIPGVMKFNGVLQNNTALTKSVMDAIPSMDPTNSGQLYLLENYYATLLSKINQSWTSDAELTRVCWQ